MTDSANPASTVSARAGAILTKLESPRTRRAITLSLGVAFVALVLAQGWINEDAFIIFRTVDNFHDGLGLRWNPFERVQTYSCPSWTLLLVAADTLVHNPFVTAIVLSAVLAVGTFWACSRWCKQQPVWKLVLLVALLASSKAFIDYSTSGLENPLANFLLGVFLVSYAALLEAPAASSERSATALLLSSAGIVLTRQDLVLIVGPAVLHALIRLYRSIGLKRLAILCALCGLPILAWEGFSLLYYGFFVPNTAFAKLGHGASSQVLSGEALEYFVTTWRLDPMTVLTVVCGAVVCLISPLAGDRLLAVGVLAYLGYVRHIGGDWMMGRFFAAPLLVSAMLLSRRAGPKVAMAVAVALLALNVVEPLAPIKVWKPYPWEASRSWGVIDPKSGKYGPKEARLLLHDARPYLRDKVFRQGVAFRDGPEAVTVRGDVGRFGYGAGPNKIVVDSMGLTDPLLARLPADQIHRSGHYERNIPDGYLETLVSGENRIADPDLATYYTHLKSVTQGPLFSGDRLRDVIALNLGRYDGLRMAFVHRHHRSPAGKKEEPES